MAISLNEFNSFAAFATARLQNQEADSLEELLDEWRIRHPADCEHAENVAAVQSAIQDMQNGDLGRPAQEVLAEARAELRDTKSA